MFSFPILLTLYAGFTHAFEADHLLAVSNIVSQRTTAKLSVKDGVFWGLGHASTIFIIGVLMILFKANIPDTYFHYFEAAVGLMLITLALYRLFKFWGSKKIVVHKHATAPHHHLHLHIGNTTKHEHSLAYGVGLVHGVAGSGALVVVVMTQMKKPLDGLTYLLVFGISCIAGMMLAAGLFSIPFSKKLMSAKLLQRFLIIASCILCLVYGGKVIYENLFV